MIQCLAIEQIFLTVSDLNDNNTLVRSTSNRLPLFGSGGVGGSNSIIYIKIEDLPDAVPTQHKLQKAILKLQPVPRTRCRVRT